MGRILRLWRTTTVRLTATFILIFVLFSVILMGFMAYQASFSIQRQQVNDIKREIAQIAQVDAQYGIRGVLLTVQRLAARPGPGVYYLSNTVGQRLAGNIAEVPSEVLLAEGDYTFSYQRQQAFSLQTFEDSNDRPQRQARGEARGRNQVDYGRTGHALVRSVVLENGLRLVVGRDIVERRDFAAIILGGFLFGVGGIIVFAIIAGGLTSMRVLRRIDTITGTSNKIMSGNLSERVPVTRRDDEFDRLATSLNAMLDRIEQLMVGLKEVTDNVAHDLKTPLTRMRNRAESALRNSSGPKDRVAALETTILESDQLIRTFNALLLIARAEAGTSAGAFAKTDISELALDMVELYAPVAEDAGLVLESDIAKGLFLNASRELIGQALVNLIENAIKYGNKGAGEAGRIVVSAREIDGRVQIEVADDGPGISEQDRDHVVKRFVRLEKSRTEPGSGLGLALVSAVASLHKGRLCLKDNAPGTRAILDFPNTD